MLALFSWILWLPLDSVKPILHDLVAPIGQLVVQPSGAACGVLRLAQTFYGYGIVFVTPIVERRTIRGRVP